VLAVAARPAKLITPAQLASRLGEPQLRIFDATQTLERPPGGGRYRVRSGRAAYLAQHIPGAAFADVNGEFADPGGAHPFTLPSAERFASAAGAAGVGPASEVVVYSASGPMWATRLWWLYRAYGFDRVAVLDGGLAAWRAAGLATASGEQRYPPASFAAHLRPELLAEQPEVQLAACGEADSPLVNALSPEVFAGRGPSSYSRPGRIPRSVNVPWRTLVDDAGRFRAPAQLRERIAPTLGAEPPIAYCGGGISATVYLFALSLIGRQDGRLYDGSLAAWSADPALRAVASPAGRRHWSRASRDCAAAAGRSTAPLRRGPGAARVRKRGRRGRRPRSRRA